MIKKAPILIRDVDVSPYDEGYKTWKKWYLNPEPPGKNLPHYHLSYPIVYIDNFY